MDVARRGAAGGSPRRLGRAVGAGRRHDPRERGWFALYSGAPERGGLHGDPRECTGYLAGRMVQDLVRVTPAAPVHVSPHGDGTLRYMDVTALGCGVWLVMWEQAVPGPDDDHLLTDPTLGRHLLKAKLFYNDEVGTLADYWIDQVR